MHNGRTCWICQKYLSNIFSPVFVEMGLGFWTMVDNSSCIFIYIFSFSLLQVLKLQACKYLMDSSLEPLYKEGALPALRELDLSYGSLCQSAIEELLAYCTHLTHVSLNGCVNMHDLNWSSNSGQFSELSSVDESSGTSLENVTEPIELPDRLLQNLNCVGCPNIKKVVIPAVARCLHLSSLNLSLSANLKEVDVACFNLGFLNLRCCFQPSLILLFGSVKILFFDCSFFFLVLCSNCSSLEVLKLQCPRLTSLFLQVFILQNSSLS